MEGGIKFVQKLMLYTAYIYSSHKFDKATEGREKSLKVKMNNM